jgi:chromate reductase
MRVLAISGSLRNGSNSTALLRALREEAPAGTEVTLWDGLKAIPPYDEDDDGAAAPATVKALRELVRDVDAVFIATPEYNSSIPGALKNALDWASRPLATNAFRNKPVAVISSSAGAFGGVWAAAELRKVLGAMGARVTDVELSVGHASTDVADDVRESLREGLDLLLVEAEPPVPVPA